MASVGSKIANAYKSVRDKVKGRPTPNSPKAGYTSDGRRYGCGAYTSGTTGH